MMTYPKPDEVIIFLNGNGAIMYPDPR